MERFKKTTLFDLQVGDRFYYLDDKNKKKFEVKSFSKRSTYVLEDGKIHSKEIKKNKKVVFLRNSNDE